MRKINVEGGASVTIRRGRAEVRYAGRFLGRIVRCRGRWTDADGQGYASPREAAEALVLEVIL